ncbi:MAG: homocysteine S-methyltransferase family protein [Acidobacteria bacterium]|nr:homocysteine S-methyltransferase family protein [Acidobacteriota bacterium]
MESILERLHRGDVIVGDGAIGTELMKRGLRQGDPPESYNLLKPEALEQVAALYLASGAEIMTTNTFGASPLRLRQFCLEKDTEAINRLAVEAVRRAVSRKAYISGSVGPSALLLRPRGDGEPAEISASFERQIRALVSAGVDMICVETMTDTAEAVLAVRAARVVTPKIPVMATMTFRKSRQGFLTMTGDSVRGAAEALLGAGADIVGSNCGNGMEDMVSIAREFRAYTRTPIAIQGNAGLPVVVESVLVYPETPEFMAAKTEELLEIGVQIIGGCCGTGPEHIRALRRTVDARR